MVENDGEIVKMIFQPVFIKIKVNETVVEQSTHYPYYYLYSDNLPYSRRNLIQPVKTDICHTVCDAVHSVSFYLASYPRHEIKP